MKNHFFFSCCGNKREEVEHIYNLLDLENIDTIVEPFCGSCAMSYYIWTQNKDKNYNTSPVVIADDDWEPTSPTGTSPVASGSGWGGLAPPPPMGGVGGSGTGAVRARVAELNDATGAVVNRTFPLRVRTEVVDAETQTPLAFTFVFPEGGWSL